MYERNWSPSFHPFSRPSAQQWLGRWFRRPTQSEPKGWALVVPDRIDPIYLVMLRRLLEHRHQTQCLSGASLEVYTYRRDQSSDDFIKFNGLEQTQDHQPYYLLLIGGPEHISENLELALAKDHAVGRLELPIPEAYLNYVSNLIRVETRAIQIKRGITFLNHGDHGVALAENYLRNEERSSKWQVCDIASHPQSDGTRALTLHLSLDGQEERAAWARSGPRFMENPMDPSGQVIVQIEDPAHQQKPMTQPLRDLMLSHPFGSALAMVNLHPRNAAQGMQAALTGLLAGLPVGASMHGLKSLSAASPFQRDQDYRIHGDPAACL